MRIRILAVLVVACFLGACADNPTDNSSPDNKSSTSGAAPRMPTPMPGRY